MIERLVDEYECEAVGFAYRRYDPALIAGRFFLPACAEVLGYPRERFFEADPAQIPEERSLYGYPGQTEDGRAGWWMLREEIRRPVADGAPLPLRPDLTLVFVHGDGYPRERAAARRRAIDESRRGRTAVLTDFARTDVYEDGRLVREYGIADWLRPDLPALLRAEARGPAGPASTSELAQRVRDALARAYRPLREAFEADPVARLLRQAGKDPATAAVQTLAYLVFFAVAGERYPYDKGHLRRFYYAYAGDGRMAKLDVELRGVLWKDINKLIRNMGEADGLPTFFERTVLPGEVLEEHERPAVPGHPVGFKFYDRALRHKLWAMAERNLIPDRLARQALEPLVRERLGPLHAPFVGRALGELLRVTTPCQGKRCFRCILPDEERVFTDPEAATQWVANRFVSTLEEAFRRRDASLFRQTVGHLRSVIIEEHHEGGDGPIDVAFLAERLVALWQDAYELRRRWLGDEQARQAEAGQNPQLAFWVGDEGLPDLGDTPVSAGHPSDPAGAVRTLWNVVAGQVRGVYRTPAAAEIAELALNMQALLRSDEGLLYPASRRSMMLQRCVGKWVGVNGSGHAHSQQSAEPELSACGRS